MLLSEQELKELTGYQLAAYQIKWLRQNGIKFLLGADGKPRVMESQIEAIIGSSTKITKRQAEPNEDALSKYMGLN